MGFSLLNVDGQAMPDLRIDPKTGVVYGAGPTIAAGSHKVWVKVTEWKLIDSNGNTSPVAATLIINK